MAFFRIKGPRKPWTEQESKALFSELAKDSFDARKLNRPKVECEDHWLEIMCLVFERNDKSLQETIEEMVGLHYQKLKRTAEQTSAPTTWTESHAKQMMVRLLVHREGIDKCEEYFQNFMGWLAEEWNTSVKGLVDDAIHRYHHRVSVSGTGGAVGIKVD